MTVMRAIKFWWKYQTSNLCCRHRNAGFVRMTLEARREVDGLDRYIGTAILRCRNCGKETKIPQMLIPDDYVKEADSCL